jgi:adenylylsulfate kinase-like enzyme
MVVWIMGLSGAGKTTLATEVCSFLLKSVSNVVLIDGDMIREMFGNDLGFDLKDRLRNAQRIQELCRFLDAQGIHVVCAILSLFPESRRWNREHIKNYFEVYIDAPVDHLKQRDSKGLYGRVERGEIRDVAGLDLEFPVPVDAEIVIENTASRDALLAFAPAIAARLLGEEL